MKNPPKPKAPRWFLEWSKPTRPVKPEETHQRSEPVRLINDYDDIRDVFDEYSRDDGYRIRIESEDGEPYLQIHRRVSVPNHNYKAQLDEYGQKLTEWKEQSKEWNAHKKALDAWKKECQKISDLNQLEKLQKKLNNATS